MAQTIRFHLDEQVNHAIADGLRRRGIDVTTTTEAGLIGVTDEEQLHFAVSQNRVLFTMDDDFLRLHGTGISHLGIIYAHQNHTTIGAAINGLELIWQIYEPDEMRDRLEYL